jgi:hypothetical protein
MDRRAVRISLACLGEMLNIPGEVSHVQTNHKTGCIEIFFTGNGCHQTAEGQETVIWTLEEWRKYDENFEEELAESWESD